ncbi:MAG: DEAD/DEAH box helicase [Bdellovibrionaceae bacterium]|nr:DEAD/DEAH box helicase [Pseudobdellovibrionaceae bacterium]
MGYAEATPIQAQAMPLVLEKKDVSGLAQTGTGKTAAFVLPLMERILRSRPLPETATEEEKELAAARGFADWRSQNFILVLVPTRELAEQVYENVVKYGEFAGLRGVSIYGGTGYDKQKEAIQQGVEFVVATPGRLIDLYKEHHVDLKQVRAIVFDEADRMFDMGFKDDMKYILQRVPRERQFLVFSATLNFDVLNTAYQFGAEPIEINISKDQAKAENVKDEIYHVGQDEKPMHLLSMVKKHNPKQLIVFSNFKMNVEKIAAFLTSNGFPAMAISSLLSQAQRNRVIEQFKSENDHNIMVATDVAARGLDIKGVDMVINYELPQDAESYVHRIGRTGRAGTEGKALSLVSDRDVDSLKRIEDYLKHKVEMAWFDEADLIKDFKPFPRDSYGRRDGPREGGRFEGRGEGGPGREGPRREGGGGRGPRRDGDRGPRREGPRRDGPGRDGDRGRGPRREGEGGEHRRADNRGPRPEGQQGQPGREGGRGPRREGGGPREGDNRGPRREGGPRDGNRGPRREGDNRGPRREGGNREGQPQHRNGQSRPHLHAKNRSGAPKTAKQQSVGQKVSGFFKKLFGGGSTSAGPKKNS